MTNSVDSNQTTPEEFMHIFWFALFAYAILPDVLVCGILGHLLYSVFPRDPFFQYFFLSNTSFFAAYLGSYS